MTAKDATDRISIPETSSLTVQSERLTHSVDSWNLWYVGFGLVALIVAFLVFFAQWNIIRKSKQLSLVQSDLIAAKDRQASHDSKDQDERIAAAQKRAADSEVAAGNAKERAGQAEERAAKAQASLASAELHAAEANAKAEGFRADIAQANAVASQAQVQVEEARRAAAEANRIAESERLARLQIEARLADRVIEPYQQLRLTQAFSKLRGQTIDLVIVGSTPETNRLASIIVGCLQKAGVLLNSFQPMSGGGAQGVLIGVRNDASDAAKEAGMGFVAILRDTLGSGVGLADYDKLQVVGNGMMGGTPGAAPLGQSAVRLQVAPK